MWGGGGANNGCARKKTRGKHSGLTERPKDAKWGTREAGGQKAGVQGCSDRATTGGRTVRGRGEQRHHKKERTGGKILRAKEGGGWAKGGERNGPRARGRRRRKRRGETRSGQKVGPHKGKAEERREQKRGQGGREGGGGGGGGGGGNTRPGAGGRGETGKRRRGKREKWRRESGTEARKHSGHGNRT